MDSTNPDPGEKVSNQEKTSGFSVPSAQVASIKGESQNSTSSAQQNAAASAPPQALPREKVVEFAIKWVIGILTIAASVVFGIWATLSYHATASGNASNDQVQNSMISVMSSIGNMASSANNIASSALSTAMAQSSALAAVQSKLDLVGQLAMVDFCITQSVWSRIQSRLPFH